jgi:hypothetical protein
MPQPTFQIPSDALKFEVLRYSDKSKATALDILEVIHNAVDQALAEGRTLAQFKKELTPVLQQLGWWGESEEVDPVTGETVNAQLGNPRRLKVIYRTNLRTARAAGQWDRIQRSQQTHPYLLYQLGPSENHREQHQAWEGLLLKAEDREIYTRAAINHKKPVVEALNGCKTLLWCHS